MFESRATELEFLDDPNCDPALAAASYRFMEMINTYTGGTAVVKHFISTQARGHKRTLRVLDIGSGSCDIPLAVIRWAAQKEIRLEFTCLETSPGAIAAARAKLAVANHHNITLRQEDVFRHQPLEAYDVATASMCFHHFSDDAILTLLQKLRPLVRKSVLINDLRRTPPAWLAAGLLTAGLPPELRHDAMLSVRRGFKLNELASLLRQIPGCAISVNAAWCFRISAVIGFAKACVGRQSQM